jgi:hypothetical protein
MLRSAAVASTLLLLISASVPAQRPSSQQPSKTPSKALPKPVSFAILEDYDKGQDLADIERDFALFNELEIRTWRGSFGWDDYEPSPGRYDFTWLRRFAERAARHGIQLRPYLGYTPEWAARRDGTDADVWNNPPADRALWARFAREIAGALAGHKNVLSYEIYNEENVKQWWDGDAPEYAHTLIRAAEALRKVRPQAPVLLGGLVFPDVEWIESVCGVRSAAASFDVLPFHAYPETWTPEHVTVENYLGGLDDFVAASDRACGRKPIWINETGFATVGGKTELEQASWWVRAVATFLSHPRVEHIGVYEIKDLPTNKAVIGDAPNYHLGLTRTDRAKKLAFYTVDLLTDLLDTGTLRVADDEVKATAEAGTHRHYFLRPDGDGVLFVWNRRSADVELRLPRGVSSLTEYDLTGKPSARAVPNDVFHVSLDANRPRIYRLRF